MSPEEMLHNEDTYLFKCELCDDIRDESEKSSCESMDVNTCDDCHKYHCPNINLCEQAGNFS